VLFAHPVRIELYTALLSVLRAGMQAVFLDPAAGREHVARCCESLPPAAFFGSAKAHFMRLASPDVRRIPVRFHSGAAPVPGSRRWRVGGGEVTAPAPPVAVAPDTPALVTFTSGSTGTPKAAVRSHGFLLAQHEVLHEALSHEAGEVELVTLPVFVLSSLASGITCVLADTDLARPGHTDVPAVIWQIHAEHVTRVAASPAFISCLVRDRADLSPLRKIFTGGAPVFPSLLQSLAEIAPHASIDAIYGSTEAEPIAHCPLAQISDGDLTAMRGGAGLLAGRPVPPIQVRVIRDQWGRALGAMDRDAFDSLTSPAGEPGEIAVTGPHVLRGYLHGIGDPETKVVVGDEVWHRTGDAGYFDPGGRLWLLGRCGASFQGARGTVFPFAVECSLSFQPGAGRCAVVRHRDRSVLVRGRSADQSHIDPTRYGLDEIVEVRSIPLDARHNAKVDYPALHALLDKRRT
jgi:acyl-CoA synthetase (AMP-forming)/AMP-acid ligase II